MCLTDFIPTELMWLVPLIIVLCLWEGILKLLAMWKSARRNELVWFVLIAFINTVGILPLLYLLLTKKNKEESDVLAV